MAEAENKRQRRTPQERANELDEKITKINQSINEQHRLECIRTMLLFMMQADYSMPLIFR